MAQKTMTDVAKDMRDIDFAMLSTRASNGAVASRPMSNNGDVEYQGDSFFFSYGSAHTIGDIERDPQVGLAFSGAKGLFGKPPLFIAVEGTASLIRDKDAFREHWTKDLDRWFPNGIDTPDIVLIKVHADRIHYWDGQEQAEVKVS